MYEQVVSDGIYTADELGKIDSDEKHNIIFFKCEWALNELMLIHKDVYKELCEVGCNNFGIGYINNEIHFKMHGILRFKFTNIEEGAFMCKLSNYHAYIIDARITDKDLIADKIMSCLSHTEQTIEVHRPKFNVGDMVVRKDCIKTEIHQVTSVYEAESLDNKFYYRLDGFMGNIIFPESGLSKVKLLD